MQKNMGFLIIILFIGYISVEAKSEKSKNTLDYWIGEYIFSEIDTSSSAPFGRIYNLKIYKEGNHYFSEINIDGHQTMVRIKTKIKGNENKIDLIYENDLPENSCILYNIGDRLLTLSKSNLEILTDWGSITPLLYENNTLGKVYFKKIK